MPIDVSKPKYALTDVDLNDAVNRIRKIRAPADSDLAKYLEKYPDAKVSHDSQGYAVKIYLHVVNTTDVLPKYLFFDHAGKKTAESKSATFKSGQVNIQNKKFKKEKMASTVKARTKSYE